MKKYFKWYIILLIVAFVLVFIKYFLLSIPFLLLGFAFWKGYHVKYKEHKYFNNIKLILIVFFALYTPLFFVAYYNFLKIDRADAIAKRNQFVKDSIYTAKEKFKNDSIQIAYDNSKRKAYILAIDYFNKKQYSKSLNLLDSFNFEYDKFRIKNMFYLKKYKEITQLDLDKFQFNDSIYYIVSYSFNKENNLDKAIQYGKNLENSIPKFKNYYNTINPLETYLIGTYTQCCDGFLWKHVEQGNGRGACRNHNGVCQWTYKEYGKRRKYN